MNPSAPRCTLVMLPALLFIASVFWPVASYGDHNNPGEPGYRFDRIYSHWMADNWEKLQGRPLRELVIPGSHDSGTYVLGNIDLALAGDLFIGRNPEAGHFLFEYCDEFLTLIPALLATVNLPAIDTQFRCSDLGQAQGENIYEQLHRGARYLDLRFLEVFNEATTSNEMRIHHTYLGPKHTEIFADILRYLEEPGHEYELIIIELKAMGGYKGGEFNAAQHKKFLEILAPLADYMYPEDADKFNITLNDVICRDGSTTGSGFCWPSGKQLLVFYEHEANGDPGPSGLTPYGTADNRLWNGSITTRGMFKGLGGSNPCTGVAANYPNFDLFPPFAADVYGVNGLIEELNKIDGYRYGGCNDYPNPTLWQSEDLLANVWMPNISTVTKDLEKPLVTGLAIGLSKDVSMIINTLSPDPDVIGWSSLDIASEFTNPRTIPHIITRPRDQVNIVTLDYFSRASGRFMPEVLKLNNNPAPARVTIEIISVLVQNKASACGRDVLGDPDCDLYPIFTVNGDQSEEPEDSLSGQHQRGNVIDNDNFVRRGSELQGDMWTHTVAVPWASDLRPTITIIDDDPSPNEDDTIAFTPPLALDNKLRELSANGTENIFFKKRSDATIGAARIVYEVCIQTWNSEPGTNACDIPSGGLVVTINLQNEPESITEGERLEFLADVTFAENFDFEGLDFRDVAAGWSFPDASKWQGSPPNIGARIVSAARASYDDDGSYESAVRFRFRLTDGTELTGIGETQFSIQNVPPTASFSISEQVIDQGEAVQLSLGNPQDPGPADVAAGFDYSYDCGNGQGSGMQRSPAYECLYPQPGEYVASGSIYDKDGGSTAYSGTVVVLDTIPPVVIPPPDISGFEATGLLTPVEIGLASATDNYDPVVIATSNAPDEFPLGTTTVTWSATDAAGNVGEAVQLVTVVDSTAPSITSLSATPTVLWPPDKTMRPISIAVTSEDIVDAAPICELADIQVNQPAAPGNKRAVMFEITSPTSALLLADRNGSDGDRVYSLNVTCTDFSGNAATGIADIIVPHDRRTSAGGGSK